jgi:outer membrane protein OmpA-like peptidoglycan-associated protein
VSTSIIFKQQIMIKGLFFGVLICFGLSFADAQVNNPGQVANDAATNQVNNDMNNDANKGINKAEQGIGNMFKKKNKTSKTDTAQPKQAATQPADNTASSGTTQSTSLKVYSNYDFIPGEKILFEDHFNGDPDGEFPTHWELEKGQALLNKMNGVECFFLTDGNYARVSPLMKSKSYLSSTFTVEYDTYNPDNNAYGLLIFFRDAESNDLATIQVTTSEVSFAGENKVFNANLPSELEGDNFKNKWHHVAIAYKNKQIKVYVDQFRILVVPNSDIAPVALGFGGIGDQTNPIIFDNVKFAEGGGMNMLGQKFTDAKIVTHGINFDVDKAIIRPESMGTLNMVIQIMKDNPEIKFDVEGFTDNTGTPAHNLTLSQQRADAVKAQLVSMGISASRLTTKGFGDTKPLSDNSTPEGKANNRRVEFVKM